jgi:tetratricopeptide (TPR) repeat protein
MTAADAKEVNPYPGPRPFERAEAVFFHGRRRDLRELLSLVYGHRIVLLYSASGAGKSSLLNAGLIPTLEQKEDFEILPVARLRGPEGDTLSGAHNVYIFSLLANWEREVGDANRIRAGLAAGDGVRRRSTASLDEPPGSEDSARAVSAPLAEALGQKPDAKLAPQLASKSLAAALSEWGRDESQPRLLVIDQFEELFTLYPEYWEQRPSVFEQLAEAVGADPLLRVVLAIREDYVAALEPFAGLVPTRWARFRLERLDERSALDAVTLPVKETHRSYAEGVPDKLVDDLIRFKVDTGLDQSVEVRGEFVEPVQLQVVCHNLWEGLPATAKKITKQHLRAFGDVNRALAQFYDDAARAAAEAAHVDERALRFWIERNFITKGGTRAFVYRARSETDGMPNEAIDELEGRHLITAEWRAGGRWYELTHDRFIEPIATSNKAYLLTLVPKRRRPDDRVSAAYASMQASAAHLEAGEYAKAARLAREALSIYKEIGDRAGVVDALNSIGWSYSYTGAPAEALPYFERARDVLEQLGDVVGRAAMIQNIGGVYLNLERPNQALESYHEALELYRSAGDTAAAGHLLAAIGDIQYSEGKPAAVESYEQAVEALLAAGDLAAAKNVLLYAAVAREDREEYEEAIALCTQALELDPEDAYALEQRADVSWHAADYRRAIADYTRSLQLNPNSATALNGRGQALAEAGKFEAALVDLDRAIELASDRSLRAYARNGRGLAYGGLGRYEDALREFQASLKSEPENAWAYFNRGCTYERMGKQKPALANFRRALKARLPRLNPWRREYVRTRFASIETIITTATAARADDG